MCKVPVKLRELVKQRLAAAAEEIFELLEKTITEYEEETERQRKLLHKLTQPRVLLQKTVSPPPSPGALERGPSLLRDPQPPHIKEEQEEEMLHCDIITSRHIKREEQLSGLTERTEDEEESLQPELSDEQTDHSSSDERETVTERTDDKQNRKIRHTCPFCGKAFVKTDNFKCHLRMHTGEKPFSCSVCGKRFRYHASVNNHKVVHSGEKPFSCSVCGKRFWYPASLNNHKVVHSGEKPFSCSVCGKEFARKVSLSRHMFTHDKEKPFSCCVCGKGFCIKPSLKKHMRSHSEDCPSVSTAVSSRGHCGL